MSDRFRYALLILVN